MACVACCKPFKPSGVRARKPHTAARHMTTAPWTAQQRPGHNNRHQPPDKPKRPPEKGESESGCSLLLTDGRGCCCCCCCCRLPVLFVRYFLDGERDERPHEPSPPLINQSKIHHQIVRHSSHHSNNRHIQSFASPCQASIIGRSFVRISASQSINRLVGRSVGRSVGRPYGQVR